MTCAGQCDVWLVSRTFVYGKRAEVIACRRCHTVYQVMMEAKERAHYDDVAALPTAKEVTIAAPVTITRTMQTDEYGTRTIELPEPVDLEAGTYRVSIHPDDVVTFDRCSP